MPIDPNIALSVKPLDIESPLDALGKVVSLRSMMMQGPLQQAQLQHLNLANQQAQQGIDQTAAINDAYKSAFALGADGVPQLDEAKLSRALATGGHGAAIPGIMEAFNKYRKSQADLAKTDGEVEVQRRNFGGSLGATVQAAKNDPNLFLSLATDAIRKKSVNPEIAAPYVQQVQAAMQQDPTGEAARQLVAQITDHLISSSPEQQKLITERQNAAANTSRATSAASQATVAQDRWNTERPGVVAKGEIEQGKAEMIRRWKENPTLAVAQVDKIFDPSVPANRGIGNSFKAQVEFYAAQGNFDAVDKTLNEALQAKKQLDVATDPRVAANKINIALSTNQGKADQTGLTEDDYARAGEQYMRTGVMPALGRDSVTRARIVKAGNQWARDNGFKPADVVQMQAAYAGDKESLKNFQKQRDQIVSFEQTAQKNLDLFLEAASRIPDTGMPWLNKPLRLLDQNMVGAENMAAVNAARQIANNEIAKVTSGGGLGGVLSDSARHEVDRYNPENATFKQTLAVAKILKQDMANRHQSMDATLGDIRSRIGGGRPAAQEGGSFKVTDPRGVTHTFPTQAAADNFKKAAGIQ